MKPAAPKQARYWRICGPLALAGFILLTLCARTNLIEAQAPAQKKKKSEPLAPARETAKSKLKAQADAAHSLTAGEQVDAAALARLLDKELRRRLAEEKVEPAPLADDAEFLRRVYLDLVGV